MRSGNIKSVRPRMCSMLLSAVWMLVLLKLPLGATETDQEDVEKAIEKTEKLIDSSWKIKEKFHNDPHRPRYHFVPPMAWMNDINGLIFWKGRYHIFYQHNPAGGHWKWMQWGHASSVDLVHWVHHPIALTPTLEGPDRDGCYSGGAFVNKEGVPTFIYHGVPDGTCIATSEDDLLIHWKKHPANPVIKSLRQGDPDYGAYKVHDPCAWLEGDSYFALVGGRIPGKEGDQTSLFKSQDLVHWEFIGPFYPWRPDWTDPREDCAVPDFFPLGNKHMLLYCSHLQGSQYYIGSYKNQHFFPDHHGWLHWPGGQLGGARTLLDAKGRRIYADWVRELRGIPRERTSGWSGVMTLPRVFSLGDDGRLRIEVVSEIEVLRLHHRKHQDIQLFSDADMVLDDIRGDSLELEVEFEPGDAREFGLYVRRSPDGAEETGIAYEPAARNLKVVVSKSTLDGDIKYYSYRQQRVVKQLPEEEQTVRAQQAPLELRDGETLKLRIFLDRSLLEVFANGRQCITQRIYPTRPDSLGVGLFSRGGSVRVRSLQAWDLAPANSY